MKPGDLVNIVDYGGYYSLDPFPIGVVLRRIEGDVNHPYEVLIDGKVKRYEIYFLRRLEENETR